MKHSALIWVTKPHLCSKNNICHGPIMLLTKSYKKARQSSCIPPQMLRSGLKWLPCFWECKQNTICSSVIATHSSLWGEVSIHCPEIIIKDPVLPFALLKDSGVSFSSLSFCPPPKTVGWMTRFMSTLLMTRKVQRSSFQNVSHTVNTNGRNINMVGRDILLKVWDFSP